MSNKETLKSFSTLLTLGTDAAVRDSVNEYADQQVKAKANDVLQSQLGVTFNESGYNPDTLNNAATQMTYGAVQNAINVWGINQKQQAGKNSNIDPSVYSAGLADETANLMKSIEASSSGMQRSALYKSLQGTVSDIQKTQLDSNVAYIQNETKNTMYGNVGTILDQMQGIKEKDKTSRENGTLFLNTKLNDYLAGSSVDRLAFDKALSDSMLSRISSGNIEYADYLLKSEFKNSVNYNDLYKSTIQGIKSRKAMVNATNKDNKKFIDEQSEYRAEMAEFLKDNPDASEMLFLRSNAATVDTYSSEFFIKELGMNTTDLTLSPGNATRNKIVDQNRTSIEERVASLKAGGLTFARLKKKLKGQENIIPVIASMYEGNTVNPFDYIDTTDERARLKTTVLGTEIDKKRDTVTELAIGMLKDDVEDKGTGFWEDAMDSWNMVRREKGLVQDWNSISPSMENYYNTVRRTIVERAKQDPSFDMTNEGDVQKLMAEEFTVDSIGDSAALTTSDNPTFQGDMQRYEAQRKLDTLVTTALIPNVVDTSTFATAPIGGGVQEKAKYSIHRTLDNKSLEIRLNRFSQVEGDKGVINNQYGVVVRYGKDGKIESRDIVSGKDFTSFQGDDNTQLTRLPMLWKFDYKKVNDVDQPIIRHATHEELVSYNTGTMNPSDEAEFKQVTLNGGYQVTPQEFHNYIDDRAYYDNTTSLMNEVYGMFSGSSMKPDNEMKNAIIAR